MRFFFAWLDFKLGYVLGRTFSVILCWSGATGKELQIKPAPPIYQLHKIIDFIGLTMFTIILTGS